MRPDELIYPLNYHAYLTEPGLRSNSLVLEIGFWVVILLGSWIFLKWYPSVFQKLEAYGVKLSRRSGLVVLLAILSSLTLRAAFLPLIPIPAPVFVDEQSYLFQAATFASGRIQIPRRRVGSILKRFTSTCSPHTTACTLRGRRCLWQRQKLCTYIPGGECG